MTPGDPATDRRYLNAAARLGLRGQGLVEPNPMVGAVVVKDAVVIGLGHHRRFGGPHAEREALDDCRRCGHDPAGSTVYTTLEPCATAGKQPACALALIESRVARVVYARADASPGKGGGSRLLRNAGIDAQPSDASPLATGLAAPWAKRVATGLPWTIAKWAQTLDGRVATRSGESKWISGEASRRRVHRLRARVDAILTGIGTVLADDPLLTARGVGAPRRVAARVVADTDLDVPEGARVLATPREAPTIIACARELIGSEICARKVRAIEGAGARLLGVPEGPGGLDLRRLLGSLSAEHAISTLLVEAGPAMVGSLLDQDLIDECVVYVAPMMLGDELARSAAAGRVAQSLSAATRLRLWRVRRCGEDVELTYRWESP